MLFYVARRLLIAVPTVFVLIVATFVLLHLAPGGPFDSERRLLPEVEANLLRAYRLDEPLHRQFVHYLGQLVRGDLGPSYRDSDFSVRDLIAAGLPISMQLGATAIALALALALPLGMLAAARQGGRLDRTLFGLTTLGVSLPSFVLAPLAVMAFAVGLGWLPAGGWVPGSPRHLVLPVTVLALPQLAYLVRLTRSSALEVLGCSFVRTARAKGLSERAVLMRHVLRPTLLPIVAYLGPTLAGLLAGSLVVEQLFSIPGIGMHFIQAALNRDYTVVLGIVLVYGILIVVFNLLSDLAAAFLDPRIRLS